MSQSKILASIKVTLVGSPQAGKSQILARFAGKPFVNKYVRSQGASFTTKDYDNFSLTVWDTALFEKSEDQNTLIKKYVQQSQLVGIIIDASNVIENEISGWIDQVRGLNPNAQIFLLVNKTDLLTDNQTIDQSLKHVLQAKRFNADIYYCSAKSDQGIEQAFLSAVSKFLSPSLSSSPLWISQHKIWTGGNIGFIVGIIAMLVIATFPFGGILALGLPISAVAGAAILGGIILAAWNGGCALVNWLKSDRSNGSPDQPFSSDTPQIAHVAINSDGDATFYDSPVRSKTPQQLPKGDERNTKPSAPSPRPVDRDDSE